MTAPAPRTRSLSPPPLPPTALIGREQEMARALTYLQRDGMRLLTLTGPSGVGKTRLGIQLAQELGERFEDGAVFVALAPLRDPSLLPAALRLKEQTPLPPAEQEPFDQTVMSARAAVDEVTFSRAWAAGSALTQDDAISFALMGLPT